MSATTPASSPAPEPIKGLAPQPKEEGAKPSPETRTLSIQEIQGAAKLVMEKISPTHYTTFYAAKNKAQEGKKEQKRLEPAITKLYLSPEDVIQLIWACQGVTWKLKDDAESSLQTQWGLLGASVPDSTKTIPVLCVPTPTGGESKLLSFTII